MKSFGEYAEARLRTGIFKHHLADNSQEWPVVTAEPVDPEPVVTAEPFELPKPSVSPSVLGARPQQSQVEQIVEKSIRDLVRVAAYLGIDKEIRPSLKRIRTHILLTNRRPKEGSSRPA